VRVPDPEPDSPAGPAVKPPAALITSGGVIPAPLLADLIRDGAMVLPVRHPGDMSAPEPGYRPSAALERFVRCRDLTCRFPNCDRPAEFCDVDHTVPYPLGPTHPSNLKCLCRKHHLVKTFRGSTVLTSNQRWVATQHLDPPWRVEHGYRIDVTGDPCVCVKVDLLPTAEDLADLTRERMRAIGLRVTAAPLINAIPAVCAAAPGIATYADMPVVSALCPS
jgi:hypothetical protein